MRTPERPSKRIRFDTNNPSLQLRSPRVKHERSPSPLSVERKLVTSGTKRYAPVPVDCLPSCPEHRKNRSDWVARCVKELEVQNLIPVRKLVRDDGLIVDWRSHVPVWSDTLRPESLDLAAAITLAHRSNAQLLHPSAQNTIVTQNSSIVSVSTSKRKLPAPPRPSTIRQVDYPRQTPVEPDPSLRPPQSATSVEDLSRGHTSSVPSDTSQQTSLSRRPPDDKLPVALHKSFADEEEMSEMTLNYLRRYVQTYELDRASLASAYARCASFAYRVHRIARDSTLFASLCVTFSGKTASGTKRTRLDIVTTLSTLPCLHSSATGGGPVQVKYDMFYLGASFGMFVVCRVVMSTKTVAHNFILQRKEDDEEDRASEEVWPLTATAHQILVFET